tara:strand:+ start:360 stop:680 length:321 start_codon:yes stop_codon:yes gene_type:complete
MLRILMDQFERASGEYARGFGIERDQDWFILKLQEELGELTQVWNRYTGRGRAGDFSNEALHKALEDETADLLGHVLLLAQRYNLDLEAAVQRKWRFQLPPSGSAH